MMMMGRRTISVDVELTASCLQALRMSLEEERARQAASNPAPAAAPSLETVAESSTPATSSAAEVPSTPAPAVKTETDDTAAVLAAAAASGGIEDVGMEGGDDMDDDLARALALSRGDDVEMGDGDEDDEDAEIARASELSIGVRSAAPHRKADPSRASQSRSRCKSRRRRRRTASEASRIPCNLYTSQMSSMSDQGEPVKERSVDAESRRAVQGYHHALQGLGRDGGESLLFLLCVRLTSKNLEENMLVGPLFSPIDSPLITRRCRSR